MLFKEADPMIQLNPNNLLFEVCNFEALQLKRKKRSFKLHLARVSNFA